MPSRANRPIPAEASAARRAEAWRLRTDELRTEADIAARLGVSQQAVSKMLAAIEREVLAELAEDVQQYKATQHARLEAIFHRAIRAFERSQQDAETVKTVEAAETEGDPTTRKETTIRGQAGDASLLAQARGALADQRDLWGLNAPAKIAPTDPHGRPLAIDPAAALAALAALNAHADRSTPGAGGDPGDAPG